MLIGYMRVSTGAQSLDLQRDALDRAGCEWVFDDVCSGRATERPGSACAGMAASAVDRAARARTAARTNKTSGSHARLPEVHFEIKSLAMNRLQRAGQQIGDRPFIRINGTLVGGLVGMMLHFLSTVV
jgi:tetrahydromethanopterin S-methyltransferase subunit G